MQKHSYSYIVAMLIVLTLLVYTDSRLMIAAFEQEQIAFEYNESICIITIGEEKECLPKEENVINYNPIWSPNGQFLAYQSVEKPRGSGPRFLYVYDLAQDKIIELSEIPSLFGWSPDSEYLLIGIDGDIYTLHLDRRDKQNLTNSQTADSRASWSPNGSYIAYTTSTDSNKRIMIMPMNDGEPYPITDAGLNINSTTPRWSPDSQTVVFVVNEEEPVQEVYVVDFDGNHLQQLTYSMNVNYQPRWSPDGTQITLFGHKVGAFNTDTEDPNLTDVFLINMGESHLLNLTDNIGLDGQPAWSPDGEWIAYTTTRIVDGQGTGDLMIMRPDGTNISQITNEPSIREGGHQPVNPAWRPNNLSTP